MVRENEVSIQYIKGVGPKRSKLFGRLDIQFVKDLLYYYPKDWQDRRLNNNVPGNLRIFKGKVLTSSFYLAKSGLGIFKAEIIDNMGEVLHAQWFKQTSRYKKYDPFQSLKTNVKENNEIWVVGRTENLLFQKQQKLQIDEFYPADDKKALSVHVDKIVPVYNLTEGLNQKLFREVIHSAISNYAGKETESLPEHLLKKRKLPPLCKALTQIHYPSSWKELESARLRMIYEEFLFLTTAWEIKRRQSKVTNKHHSYKIKKSLLTPFRKKMGFDFTMPQKKVINEIFRDMCSKKPMTRLLQGDVGSGKTVVALSAMLLAVENKFQSAFMAPTEILAEQHLMTFKKFLKHLPVTFEILTSKTTKKQKLEILEKTKTGKIDILIGTHAIIEDNVKFKNLKLAVIDEQHRFGVRQRAMLRQKAQNIDLLIMTATPIPRTLALAFYGDLDVSTIDSLPPGRQPIITREVSEQQSFDTAREEIKKGRQVYIVHPLIEESKALELKSVKEEFEKLSKNEFPNSKVEMIHGQMRGKLKTKIMEDFLAGKINVLLATPVIEVGIDVKNATLMIIQNPERFGLASLHQLRGRVGRGKHESSCLLVTNGKGTKRTKALCSFTDGFKIGEIDMEIRGPGEVLGTRQHGEMETRIGDILKDRELLNWALEDRNEIVKKDPNLIKPEHRTFRKKLLHLYSHKWHLIDLS
jgi:ATP-dependent DNA helicase RecG